MNTAQTRVFNKISDLVLSRKTINPLLVAISGKDASGKSIMADNLSTYLARKTTRHIIRISIDDFMNERTIRYTESESAGRSCYDYTFNYEGFIDYVLKPLSRDGNRRVRDKIFDHQSNNEMMSPYKVAENDGIVIVDGVFLYRHEMRDYWDVKILLHTNDEENITRGALRDQDRIGSYELARQKYIERYIASQTIYYTEENPELCADMIIDNNNYESPFILK